MANAAAERALLERRSAVTVGDLREWLAWCPDTARVTVRIGRERVSADPHDYREATPDAVRYEGGECIIDLDESDAPTWGPR